MEVISETSLFPHIPDGAAVTIGVYDGVHIGHQRLITATKERAAQLGIPTVVITFDKHPATIVRPGDHLGLLTDLDMKLELLARLGVDYTLLLSFDKRRSEESPGEFVQDVLVGTVHAKVVVVGENFHFGHDRSGDIVFLTKMGHLFSFEVVAVPLARDMRESEVVSSTRIRELLKKGMVEAAADLLARPYQLRGNVVHGSSRGGTELGFPTANLKVKQDVLIPSDGIYAGIYHRPGGEQYEAAISIGFRPTFDELDLEASTESYHPSRTIEAYLIGFNGNLYGEEGRLDFIGRIRDELKFDSPAELAEQIERDVAQVRLLLRQGRHGG
ncbi:MAG: bifunctional riboflavin kinase/FAD synthetase [Actinobacteria bacterium]|nr:bifunctional riboflavin kinase/FAD synthetase [Actinomycetota bacterium]MCL6095241.1 bifunctional riboflavin kinase/FAD synthetase [Actinomycetota bacterium]